MNLSFATLGIAVALSTLALADAEQRLRPWASIAPGALVPEERELPGAAWTTAARNSQSPRLVQTINRDWTFNYLPAEEIDEKLLAPDFDDAKWPAVAVPHTWHTFETTGGVHPFTLHPSERDSPYWWNGWGYYRKQFTLDAKAVAGRKVFVEFDAVMKYCRVHLNGKFLGEHQGGYSGFYFDLTDHLQTDAPNVLTVAVNARRDDPRRIAPMNAGNFNLYGGINRDVRIVVKDRVHIPFQGSHLHEGGTFVTTPKVSAEAGEVRVRTWVKNDAAEPREVTLRTMIFAPGGERVTMKEAAAKIEAGKLHEFDQSGIAVEKPKLWSPETPVLYRVESEVRAGDEVVDRFSSPLGFRWFEWNHQENRGYLNGQRLHLHGTNRHQEFPWLGDAIPKWMHVRDLFDIRFGQGHNWARYTHYPQDPLVYDLSDRYGILVCEEVPNIKNIDFSKEVQKQMVIEMIRRDRNHPGIVMWSMGNETSRPADSTWAHAEDPTRILHLRHGNRDEAGPFITHTDENLDMENVLRCTVRGWTDRDVADFQPENGQHTGHEEWQHAQARVNSEGHRGRMDIPNGCMWLYADHGADREYQNNPLKHVNPKGWVDLYRIPKYLYYLWQANYVATPTAFIHPHPWQARYVGQKRDIVVDSNAESVELKVNGRSAGVRKPTAETFHTVTFKDVPVERGVLSVEAVKGGQTIKREVTMAGEPARLTLEASHAALDAGKDAVAILTADVVDADGHPVQNFSKDLKWKVEGPATLLTPETYQSDIRKKHAMSGSFYIVAPVSTLIRATGQPGAVSVTVSAEGVKSATFAFLGVPSPEAGGFVRSFPLSDAGRVAVAHALDSAGGAGVAAGPMKRTVDDLRVPTGKDAAYYAAEVEKWFQQNNPEVIARAPAFAAAREVFAGLLQANNGVIVADDFNHSVQQVNDYADLDDALSKHKLPVPYAEAVRRYFAQVLIREGKVLRVSEELHWVRALPDEAPIETLTAPATGKELFSRFYPPQADASASQRDAAFANFKKVNLPCALPVTSAKADLRFAAETVVLKPTFQQLLRIP